MLLLLCGVSCCADDRSDCESLVCVVERRQRVRGCRSSTHFGAGLVALRSSGASQRSEVSCSCVCTLLLSSAALRPIRDIASDGRHSGASMRGAAAQRDTTKRNSTTMKLSARDTEMRTTNDERRQAPTSHRIRNQHTEHVNLEKYRFNLKVLGFQRATENN